MYLYHRISHIEVRLLWLYRLAYPTGVSYTMAISQYHFTMLIQGSDVWNKSARDALGNYGHRKEGEKISFFRARDYEAVAVGAQFCKPLDDLSLEFLLTLHSTAIRWFFLRLSACNLLSNWIHVLYYTAVGQRVSRHRLYHLLYTLIIH